MRAHYNQFDFSNGVATERGAVMRLSRGVVSRDRNPRAEAQFSS
jgi:hypothetical protein